MTNRESEFMKNIETQIEQAKQQTVRVDEEILSTQSQLKQSQNKIEVSRLFFLMKSEKKNIPGKFCLYRNFNRNSMNLKKNKKLRNLLGWSIVLNFNKMIDSNRIH